MAAELYYEIEARACEDIDILIDIIHFKEYDDILKDLGYEHDFSGSYEQGYEQLCLRHIRYYKEIEGVIVLLEVHSSIINPANLFKCDSQQFILNARQIELFGMKPLCVGNRVQYCYANAAFFQTFAYRLSSI